MSRIVPESTACPGCGAPLEIDVLHSVNVDRRPDLREAVLAHTLQRGACAACGEPWQVEPELTWLDARRRRWFLVQPAAGLARWTELERHADALFDRSFGPGAPAAVREAMTDVRPRVLFGWHALREKLLCDDLGVDDVELELAKLAILRAGGELELSDAVELRLTGAEDGAWVLTWLDARTGRPVEEIRLDADTRATLRLDDASWAPLREELSAGPFVDAHRLLVG